LWADFDTSSAPQASVAAQGRLGIVFPAFGVVTPPAAQGAAFEEYGCADAGAVVYGVPLYVENESGRIEIG